MAAAYAVAIALGSELRVGRLVGAVVCSLKSRSSWLRPCSRPTSSATSTTRGSAPSTGSIRTSTARSRLPTTPAFAQTAWRHVGSAYGPLFTIGSYPLAHLGVAAALWAFKAVAALASLGCVALVWRIARQLRRPPGPAVAIFGLNPLLLVWTVGGAHNDLLMLVLTLAGVSLALASREALGGAAVVAAAAVKATAGLAIPFLLLGARRRGRVLAGVAGAAVLLYVLAAEAFPGHALGVVSVLRGEQHRSSRSTGSRRSSRCCSGCRR